MLYPARLLRLRVLSYSVREVQCIVINDIKKEKYIK